MSELETKQQNAQTTAEAPTTPRRGLLRSVLQEGGPGVVYFAINNACNARCDFCNFSLDRLPKETWKFVDLNGARDAFKILRRQGIGYIIIFGGEPLLHPDVVSIVEAARDQGMTVLLISNGARLTPDKIRQLDEAGVSTFIISVDAASVELHEGNRGLPGVCEKIKQANRVIREVGRTSIASVTMSRLVDYDKLPDFLRTLGFDCVSFSYPINYLGSSFLAQSESELINFSADELDKLFLKIKDVRRKIRVNNPNPSIDDMRRFIRGEKQHFECLGGFRYFHLDWDLNLWRCHHWSEPMCSVFDFDGSQIVRDGCTECMIDCYRDSSVMQHVAVSVHDAYQALTDGKIGEAARAITRPTNLGSIRAVMGELTSVLRYL